MTNIPTGHEYAAFAAPAPQHCECHDAHEQEMLTVIDERDRAIEAADDLSLAIAPLSEIGEHSNANEPWANAMEIAHAQRAELAALRADRDELAEANRTHGRSLAAIRATLGLRHDATADLILAAVCGLVDEHRQWRDSCKLMGRSFAQIAEAAGIARDSTSCEVQDRVEELQRRLARLADRDGQ